HAERKHDERNQGRAMTEKTGLIERGFHLENRKPKKKVAERGNLPQGCSAIERMKLAAVYLFANRAWPDIKRPGANNEPNYAANYATDELPIRNRRLH